MNGWLGGLHIRCGGRGQLTIADYLCTVCGHHARLVGTDNVRHGARDLPITHQAQCPARKATP